MENTPSQDLEKLIDLIKDIKTAMFTTAEVDGTLRSRPMRTQQVKPDGILWFFTGEDSAKTHEIQQDRHVNVSYMDDASNTYVSVSGRARTVKDKAKIDELWKEPLKAWFPEGKDDPNIALIKVTIDQAEYWDAPSSTLVHLYGMAKAAITGEPAHPGDNKKINL
ncbi:pyridoxamine 5'-phosphate oxidase family protein [Adhaeribacter radiodurans]|uniref:Pyridoxamine 5'-phosphate oxidase family protein n=1 Tax=Adhaeribacter radiodurans TaxID=2745197 RepID=A0A7L7L688_9BACT|nr:pyridoxamine 5'-phosphate oxidase family protein [Adhaeribacter radiodurans]QMU28310.1 pyridoxamine 5'-phosphate oxidase family protein [Adhaeribacter radiodurans]